MDEVTKKVSKMLITYRRDPDYEDILQECVLVSLENPDVDYKTLSFLVKNRAIEFKANADKPVYVPYRNKFDKRVKSSSRNLGETSSVQPSESDSIVEDHSDDVLLEASISSLEGDLREFSYRLKYGQAGVNIRKAMGLSITGYYNLLRQLEEELY